MKDQDIFAACDEQGPEVVLHWVNRWCQENGRRDLVRAIERMREQLRVQDSRRSA